MSASKKMTLRIQSAEGTTRVDALDTEATARLFERVHEALHLASFAFALHKDRARKDEVLSSKTRTLRDYGLQHGDMLFLSPVNGALLFEQSSTNSETNNKSVGELSEPGPSTSRATVVQPSVVSKFAISEEDEVDLELYSMPGTIQRQRDEKLCRHNSKGCCVHCSPLEPWDEDYLKEHNIKHMSFHAYLRKMTTGNGKFISLDEISCKIKPGCKEHPPWPRGICSQCQPNAVTLMRQPYRHVDNVVLEHAAPVDRFLAYWRATGHQRVGLLLGRYERHPDVPLGIRARVAAIYEPPQEGSRDGVSLLADPHEALLLQLARRLGLRSVGWLFTDLLPLDLAAGTVKCVRGVDTHFLSAQECIMAGHYQNLHPNACRYASSGYFGSKFVTVCVTGDSNNQIHLEGYQVSGQCQALVRDGVLLPTRDAPDLGYIRETSPQQYVPLVYYKERDAYGNEVGVSARRVPVAYLLVDVPCGVAPDAPPTFSARAAFPPAHRHHPQHHQSLRALHHHIQAADSFLEAMSDLHVLLFLMTNEALPLGEADMAGLVRAVAARDGDAAAAWRTSSAPATLMHLAAAAADAPHPHIPHHPHHPPHPHHPHPSHRASSIDAQDRHSHSGGGGGGGSGGGGVWTCPLCTFHNAPHLDACEMCAMPKNSAM